MNMPIYLQCKTGIELFPKAPFNFDATLHKPDHFPSADNAWEPGIRWQTMLWQDEHLGLKFENGGTLEQPRIALSIWSSDELDLAYLAHLTSEIQYRYNLNMDLHTFYRRLEADPQLAPILHKWRGLKPMSPGSLYEYLIIATVLQNATVRRSVNMLQSLFEHFGSLLSFDGRALYCYWAPEAMDRVGEQELRQLRVGYRAKSIKRVSQAFSRQEIDEQDLRRKSRDEQRKALLDLYGIGPASVGYILFDVFHHLDELEYISPWEQKIYTTLFFGTPTDAPVEVNRLLNFFEQRFGQDKMLAVHYVWEDLFWKRKNEKIDWLEELIRL